MCIIPSTHQEPLRLLRTRIPRPRQEDLSTPRNPSVPMGVNLSNFRHPCQSGRKAPRPKKIPEPSGEDAQLPVFRADLSDRSADQNIDSLNG